MNEARKKRVALIALLLLGVGGATALALVGASQQINVFFSPSEIAEGKAQNVQRVRLGGLVKEGSLWRDPATVAVRFKVTDRNRCVTVNFDKILPDLFREGDSVIASGLMQADGSLKADEVLAKHDENYMPPEVAQTMAKAKALAAQAKRDHTQDCAP
jgi:cytochrome c-type biogenesis protein CcmE